MKSKYIVASFIAGVLMTLTITAGANTIYEKYTAVARPDYTLVVDGEKVALNTPPKTIEGATHLPLREMATILGKNVNFKSGTITLTTKNESEGDRVTTSTTENTSNETTISNEWISLRDIAVEHGLQVGKTSDSNGMFRVWKNDLVYFEFNPSDLTDVEYVEVKAFNDSTVTIKLEESHYYIGESDVSEIFQ